MTIKYLLLSTGYVESQALGSVLISHDEGFATAEEAIVDFSTVLKGYVEKGERQAVEWNRTWDKCCKKSIEKDAAVAFCSKCGKRLVQEQICHSDLVHAFSDIEGGTLDGFGEGWEFFRKYGWNVPSFDHTAGQMAVVTDFRPVVSGLEDEDARCSNNEIMMSAICEAPTIDRKSGDFDYSVLPESFVRTTPIEDED